MADKELRHKFEDISDPQTITDANIRKFREAGLDIHQNDVVELIDDHGKKIRVLKVRNRKYFGNWKRRG